MGLLTSLEDGRESRFNPRAPGATARRAEMRRRGISSAAIAAAREGLKRERPDVLVRVLRQRLELLETQRPTRTSLLDLLLDGAPRSGAPNHTGRPARQDPRPT
jgi:hypothetical protein